MSDLADRRCEPCRGSVPALRPAEAARFLPQVPGWEVVDDHHLRKRWTTSDFAAALDLVRALAAVAEEQDHHPDLAFGWGWAEARIWTHKVDGLTVADFVLAAIFDRAVADRAGRPGA